MKSSEPSRPRIKILVACHKPDVNIRQDNIYMPIQVGKALHPEIDLGFQCDNTGDNISEKNDNYCELTALYWAWKNLKDVDYIGLCHYRRYFDITESEIIHAAESNQIILASPMIFPFPLWMDYSLHHNSSDIKAVGIIVKEKTEMGKPWIETMYYNNKLSPFNMFLMPFSEFDAYCQWLFGILDELERRTQISNDPYQSRIFGFLSERLLNVYFHGREKTYRTVINTERACEETSEVRRQLYILKSNFLASFFYGKEF